MLRQAPCRFIRCKSPVFRHIPQSRRLLSTAPPSQKSRSWKSSTARWGIAIGLLYWYNTNNLFAEEAAYPISQPLSPSDEVSLPTLDSIAEARQQKPSPPSSPPPPPSESSNASSTLEETEEDAHAQGAFNEETGEINWDCPCLGGMAHGPCGPQFREAFSCFVHSEDEVKGMDCVQHFQAMQDCFRAHPEEYGEQFEQQSEEVEGAVGGEVEGDGEVVGGVVKGGERGDEEVGGTLSVARQGAVRDGGIGGAENGSSQPPTPVTAEAKTGGGKGAVTAKAKKAKEQVSKDFGEPKSEIDEIVPKAAHDAR